MNQKKYFRRILKKFSEVLKEIKCLNYFTSLTDFLGRKLANFFAAASIDSAAPNNSFSAIMVGSSGLRLSLPNEGQ